LQYAELIDIKKQGCGKPRKGWERNGERVYGTTRNFAILKQVGCRTRKYPVCGQADYRQPGIFQWQIPKEIQALFQRAADFLIDRVGRENIVSAVIHMDEKTPHLHLTFVPLTKDNRLCAKEIIGNRANLTKWQDDFHACMVEKC
jgi:hypothetical protein